MRLWEIDSTRIAPDKLIDDMADELADGQLVIIFSNMDGIKDENVN